MILALTAAICSLIFAKSHEPAAALFSAIVSLCALIAMWRELR